MSNSRIAADRLKLAIRRSGWTYARAAAEVRRHLPQDTKLSSVSVWSYATGRTTPRRESYIKAIEAAFGVPPWGLGGPEWSGGWPAGSPSLPADPSEDASASSEDQSKDVFAPPPFGQGAPGGSPASALILADMSDGKVRMKIDTVVSWHVAIRIFDILKPGDAAGDDAEESGGNNSERVPGRAVNGRA